jgi:peptidyl-prolyl cis-trans isomerase D
MFDFVRSHTKLFQGLLVLLIFPSFVFFGVQGYTKFTEGATATVATVAGMPIKQNELDSAHRQQVERMRQQMPNADIKLLDTPAMKQRALDQLIRERVIAAAVTKDHLSVSDTRLARLFAADPQMQVVRKADGSINKELLAAQGMSVRQFEENLRQEYALRQVLAAPTDSALRGHGYQTLALNALLERREVQWQRFDAKDYLARITPTEAEIDAYYKAHSASFRSPESAQIEYVVLDLDALKKQVSVTEDDLRKYYDENISRYTMAEERRASHILIGADKSASQTDRDKAKAKAESLLAEVRKHPESFADVAKKNSSDTGSAERGGDLDFFGRGAMVKPFEDAAYAMKPGEISNVVESEFGFHIIKLTGIRGGEKKPFDAVRAEIQDEVAKQLAQKRYAEVAEQFTNMVYEQADSLQPAVDKLKLIRLTANVSRNAAPGTTGPLASTKLLEAIFGNEVLKNKHNTEALETGPNQLVSARVTDYHPEQVQPLAQVQAQVLEQLRAEQAAAAARKDGDALLATQKKDAGAALPLTVTVSRTQSQDIPSQVVKAALQADLSGKAPVAVGVDLGRQGYAVVKVLRVVERDTAKDADEPRARAAVDQAAAAAEAAAYFEWLKRRFKVEVKPQALKVADVAGNETK